MRDLASEKLVEEGLQWCSSCDVSDDASNELSPLSEVVHVLVRGESAVPELGLDLGRIISARCGVVR